MRARIVLLAGEDRSTRSIAKLVDVVPRTVSLWRGRHAREGLVGVADKPRPGPPAKYDVATGRRLLAVLEKTPPSGFARWTAPLIAAHLGDVHEQQVWRFLRAQRIDLSPRKSWCESKDPEFVEGRRHCRPLHGAADNALVICVDEKPSIQALERAQGYLKLPNGRALTGQSYAYKRHGTTTSCAAFEVATGKVQTAHQIQRCRVEFLAFIYGIVAAHPGRALHVILDNLNTHKKNEAWLAQNPQVSFHFTPTSASWLNQVEIWFSILQAKSLRGASFTSVEQLRIHMNDFIDAYNEHSKPFTQHWIESQLTDQEMAGEGRRGVRLSNRIQFRPLFAPNSDPLISCLRG